jgi:hypothetical protein
MIIEKQFFIKTITFLLLVLLSGINGFTQSNELSLGYGFPSPTTNPGCIEYHNDNLWICGTENSTIYRTDTSGILEDSIFIENVQISGFAFHKEELFVAGVNSINDSVYIIRVDDRNGAKVDSFAIHDRYHVNDLCSDGNNLFLITEAGWSSGIYLVDTIQKSITPESYRYMKCMEYYQGIFLSAASNELTVLNKDFIPIETYTTDTYVTDLAHDHDNIWICCSDSSAILRANNFKLGELSFPKPQALHVLPRDYPSESDNVKVSFKIDLLKGGCNYAYNTVHLNDSTIGISFNYNSTFPCQKEICDTIELGKLQHGGYQVIFSVIDEGSFHEVSAIDTIDFKVYPWSKRICDSFQVTDIIETNNGNYAITGWNRGNVHDAVAKLVRNDGELVWSHQYGGNSNDYGGRAICQMEDDNFYVAGSTCPFSEGEYGDDDIWVLKLDENGDTIWSKTYGGGGMDKANAISQIDDHLYICGLTRSFGTIGQNDLFVIKIDEDGELIWKETYGPGIAHDIKITSDKNLVLTGSTGDEVILMKIDRQGLKKWKVTYVLGGTRDCGYEVYELADKSYLVCGEGNQSTVRRFESYTISDSLGNLLVTQENDRSIYNESNYVFWLDSLNLPFVKNLDFDYRYYIKRESDSICFIITSIKNGIYAYKIITDKFASQSTEAISNPYMEVSNADFVYPNPVGEILSTRNHDFDVLYIYSINGILMMAIDAENKNQIDISNLQEGAYILVFSGKQYYITKIIKE